MQTSNTILLVGEDEEISNLLVTEIKELVLDKCAINEVMPKLINDPSYYEIIILSISIEKSEKVELIKQIHLCSDLKFLTIIVSTKEFTINIRNEYLKLGARYCLPVPLDKEFTKIVITKSLNDCHKLKHIPEDIIMSNNISEAIFKIQNLKEAQALSSFLANTCPNPKLALMGLGELLINAIEHGNLHLNYDDKTQVNSEENWIQYIENKLQLTENKEKFVEVIFKRTNTNITIKIIDQGNGFDWEKYQNLDQNRIFDTHGRGIYMAKNLAFQNLEYQGKGNIVIITINLT